LWKLLYIKRSIPSPIGRPNFFLLNMKFFLISHIYPSWVMDMTFLLILRSILCIFCLRKVMMMLDNKIFDSIMNFIVKMICISTLSNFGYKRLVVVHDIFGMSLIIHMVSHFIPSIIFLGIPTHLLHLRCMLVLDDDQT